MPKIFIVTGDGGESYWQSHPFFYREIFARLRGQPDAARS
jgi:hypothetical protein